MYFRSNGELIHCCVVTIGIAEREEVVADYATAMVDLWYFLPLCWWALEPCDRADVQLAVRRQCSLDCCVAIRNMGGSC